MGSDGVKIAAAMAAGYLIGRTRKGRLVFMLIGGVLMAGRAATRLGLDESRLVGVFNEVLGDVQRSAGEALNTRVGQFSDSLQSRTEGLTGCLGVTEDDEDEDEADASDGGQPRGQDSNGAGEDDEKAQPSRRPDRGRATGGRAPSGSRRREPQAAGRSRR